ncbi:MAG: TIGR00730 family Rossman fold protein [Endozoicomonas sp.]
MTAIGVFCGARDGVLAEYREAAIRLVDEMVSQGITLVYGGGNRGLMGTIAERALSRGGKVIGVMPRQLMEMEIGHHGLSEFHVVDSMYERKKMLTELSDAFVTLPGGIGTLDELFEEMALIQTGFHVKPLALLNTCHYYDHLLNFLEHARSQGYINSRWLEALIVREEPGALVRELLSSHLQGS